MTTTVQESNEKTCKEPMTWRERVVNAALMQAKVLTRDKKTFKEAMKLWCRAREVQRELRWRKHIKELRNKYPEGIFADDEEIDEGRNGGSVNHNISATDTNSRTDTPTKEESKS